MKSLKKSLGISVSVLLLLSFSMTLIPLDFLHNHQVRQVHCPSDKANTACTHKLQITQKADFCWVCAVHYDKTFTIAGFFEELKLSPGLSLFINNETVGYFMEHLFTGMRGPPAE